MTRVQAAHELGRRGFVFSYLVDQRDFVREYWVWADGRKNVMLDHTATITSVGYNINLITDFSRTTDE